jgi:c-di-AMP phosphodiesterase-like protein
MDKDLELSKVRILANHLQSKANSGISYFLAFYVSSMILFVTLHFNSKIDDISLLLLFLIFTAFVCVLIVDNKKTQTKNLAYIDTLLKKIENGEALPSLIELEKSYS